MTAGPNRSYLAGDVVAHIDLLVVQEHAIDGLNGGLGGFGGLVVDETVTLRAALLVRGDLARQNVSERSERVMKGLVVNGLVQILDEDVALPSLAERRITLGPHDTANDAGLAYLIPHFR